MSLLSRKQLLAIENMNIIMKARQNGLAVFEEDLRVNYAEIDITLEELEDSWRSMATNRLVKSLMAWAKKIQSKEDLEKKMDISAPFQQLIMGFIMNVWDYGQTTADEELLQIEVGEFAGGKASTESLTNTDAFEWYQLYTRALAKNGSDAAFTYMQPLILEKLDEGTVGTELAAALEDDFRRFGQVRTGIIARTESNKAFNWGRRYRFDKSAAIAGYRYSAILDERTTEICQALHGHSWEITDPALDQHTPPNHYQCRSILVAISKYVSFTFDPPASGWEDDLPEKEKEVFNKFKDSTFYPKAETVAKKFIPKMAKPKKKAAPKNKAEKTSVLPKIDKNLQKQESLQKFIDQSHQASIQDLQNFVDFNLKKGVNPAHPIFADIEAMIHEIESGIYSGKMIAARWNNRNKAMEILEYEQRGNIFWRKATKSISAADTKRMLEEIDRAAEDPFFLGVKIELVKEAGIAGSYNGMQDVMKYTPIASTTDKRLAVENGDLGTLYHEIGHRTHLIDDLYKGTPYEQLLRDTGINITADDWKEWKKTADPFWEDKYTPRGSDLLPDDLYLRYDYPINAKQYYKKGTKDNFYKEMWAETTSVYLEGNQGELQKVERAYPGLLPFLEKIYKRGRFTLKRGG